MVGIAGVFYREQTKRHLLLAQPRVAEFDPVTVTTFTTIFVRFFMGFIGFIGRIYLWI